MFKCLFGDVILRSKDEITVKRLLRKPLKKTQRKRPRLADLTESLAGSEPISTTHVSVTEAFEHVSDSSQIARKIELKIPQAALPSKHSDNPAANEISLHPLAHRGKEEHPGNNPSQALALSGLQQSSLSSLDPSSNAVIHQHPPIPSRVSSSSSESIMVPPSTLLSFIQSIPVPPSTLERNLAAQRQLPSSSVPVNAGDRNSSSMSELNSRLLSSEEADNGGKSRLGFFIFKFSFHG